MDDFDATGSALGAGASAGGADFGATPETARTVGGKLETGTDGGAATVGAAAISGARGAGAGRGAGGRARMVGAGEATGEGASASAELRPNKPVAKNMNATPNAVPATNHMPRIGRDGGGGVSTVGTCGWNIGDDAYAIAACENPNGGAGGYGEGCAPATECTGTECTGTECAGAEGAGGNDEGCPTGPAAGRRDGDSDQLGGAYRPGGTGARSAAVERSSDPFTGAGGACRLGHGDEGSSVTVESVGSFEANPGKAPPS